MEVKPTILIADDLELNRELLMVILGDKYRYLCAENGREVLYMLQQDLEIDLVLLDINMPEMDGFQVLEQMNRFEWSSEIPVIMITAEDKKEIVERAYSLGAEDYLHRPFDSFIVRRRVQNILKLYTNQKQLRSIVLNQIQEREKDNHLMINMLASVVELRSGENGKHIEFVREITEMLLHKLLQLTDEYHLTESDIALITTASALHDIGKISIPESILNKPTELNPDEFEVMKTHTTVGADIIRQFFSETDEKPLLRIMQEICRWHHERWDGRGYPDGLRGEQIPISAQVVGLANAYETLISERCYKKACDYDVALEMILNGERGAFNPVLLNCLCEISAQLENLVKNGLRKDAYRFDADRIMTEMVQKKNLPQSDRAQKLLGRMQEKRDFYASLDGGIQFDYDAISGSVDITNWNETPERRNYTVDITNVNWSEYLSMGDVHRLKDAMDATTFENREFAISVMMPQGDKYEWRDIKVHTLWSEKSPDHYIGAVGQILEPRQIMAEIPNVEGLTDDGVVEGKKIKKTIQQLKQVFDIVRLVDPSKSAVLELNEEGHLCSTGQFCAAFWENGGTCANCISSRALAQKTMLNKLEFTHTDMYYVVSKYLSIDGNGCVLEMLSKMKEGRWVDANGSRLLLDRKRGEVRTLLSDPLTGAYSRRYYKTYFTHLEGMECVEVIDVDRFKSVNDTYGHGVGDQALHDIAQAIQSCIRNTDILIRYGGDEFLLLFPKLPQEYMPVKNAEIQKAVENIVIPGYPDLHLSVSIGGVCGVHPLEEAVRQADKLMYENKKRRR